MMTVFQEGRNLLSHRVLQNYTEFTKNVHLENKLKFAKFVDEKSASLCNIFALLLFCTG